MKQRIKSLFAAFLRHRLTIDGMILFAGTMVANLGAYLYHLVVGRMLGREGYSEIAALLSLVYILNVPALVLQTTLTKFFSAYKATGAYDKARSLFFAATKYFALVAAFLLVVSLPLAPLLGNYLKLSSRSLVVWLFGGFAFFVLSTVNGGLLQGFQRFRQLALLSIAIAAIRLLFGAAGAPLGVSWTVIANTAASAASYAFYFLPLGFILQQKARRTEVDITRAIRYMVPTTLAILGITAAYSMDVVLVKHYFSASEAGVYSALSILGKIIYYASFTVGTILFPVLAERQERKERFGVLVRAGLVAVATISLALAALYGLFPTAIVRLLYGSVYDGASPYLFSFGLFMTFFSLSYLLIQVCLAVGHTRVWLLAVAAAVAQALLITSFHETLWSVVTINIAVTAVLFSALLVYYALERRYAR